MTIKVSKEFTKCPGGRFKKDGKFSGEEFYEILLKPRYEQSINNNEKLIIDLDGGYGYPSSFLKQAFGMLAYEMNDYDIMNDIIIISDDEPSLINDINKYISDILFYM